MNKSSLQIAEVKTDSVWQWKKLTWSLSWLKAIVIPAVLIIAWGIASALGWIDAKLIPAPWLVVDKAIVTLQQNSFWISVFESSYRLSVGFGLGALLGLAFGIVLASSKLSQWVFAPSFHAIRQVSLFAWLPLISTFLGYGDSAKILFIALSVFYPVALNTFEGISGISNHYREVAAVYQFSPLYRLKKLILPAASSSIFVGLQLGLMFAWLATVGSEFLLANYGNGLGNLVIRGREQFDVALIIFGMLLIGGIGLILSSLLQRIERRILKWQYLQGGR